MTTSFTSRLGQEEFIFYGSTTFRFLLDCLTRPGKINHLRYPAFLGEPPSYYASTAQTDIPLNFYALGALLTLLDGETTFGIAANGQWLNQDAPVVSWLALRSGASAVLPARADFALFCDGQGHRLLPELNMGSLLEPEISTTAIYCVEQLSTLEELDGEDNPKQGDDGGEFDVSVYEVVTIRLSGPGIAGQRVVKVTGLDRTEIGSIQSTRRSYPLGIDIYLVDALGRCIGLPRTTKLQLLDSMEG